MCELVSIEDAADRLAQHATYQMARSLDMEDDDPTLQTMLICEYEHKYDMFLRMEPEELEYLYLSRILNNLGSVTVFNQNEDEFPEYPDDPDLPLWAASVATVFASPQPICPMADV